MSWYGLKKTYCWDIECLPPGGLASIKVIQHSGAWLTAGARWKSIWVDGFIDDIKSHLGLDGGEMLARGGREAGGMLAHGEAAASWWGQHGDTCI